MYAIFKDDWFFLKSWQILILVWTIGRYKINTLLNYSMGKCSSLGHQKRWDSANKFDILGRTILGTLKQQIYFDCPIVPWSPNDVHIVQLYPLLQI